MKYKATLFAAILSAIFFMHCSGDPQDDYRNFNPTTPDPTSKPPDNPTAYVDTSNARMIVHTIDESTWITASERGYINAVFLGTIPPDGFGAPGSTNTIRIFMDPKSDHVFIRQSDTYQSNILGGGPWEIKYVQQDDRLEINGQTGKSGGYFCTGFDEEAVSYVLSFVGIYNEFNFRYEGTYVWEQNSIYSGCELRCSGSMSIQIE